MGVMFSSPGMIMLFITGVIILIVFFGGIITAIVQTVRGNLKVDYDAIAARNAVEDEERRRMKKLSKQR
ncbi:hypothetical protein P4S91_11260 [Aneurinibacillus aneurinilyticus]|jgi:hypothetical protein|uniref:Uncharacterized protein n=2 Tax=Aneurinibacillus aneurinilyticus TaxID=1391 RepID=A0A848CS81_ANEAE|nr:hypothetical protein [Aneurinibacillus aneurinilyticus]MCI1694944.1 hypothetical protein [Aneurinibacillus aneurinilyticus]MED0670323.1 hypothetical protein [Aneurinibacillus aneurinilyticus]MED0723495.1 hypothetical protein [Aneurinibacillus aneurinilyticus]NME98038.1 hypothetical protein [Aneurinibacillus aneurinilyticus]